MRWTTIGLSAGQQYAQISQASPAPAEVNKKNRIASVWIPAILGIGLLTAFAYLGVRIVAAKSSAPPAASQVEAKVPAAAAAATPAAAQPTTSQPQKPAPPMTVSKTASKPALPDFTVITPQAGERYLQVAAVSPHMVLTYVDTLRKTNLEPVVAPGPTPDLMRILVGPFNDTDSLDKAKAQLVTAGKSPIIRSY